MTEPTNAAPHAPLIVVGVDGSDASKDALRWALHQAEVTGGSVQALMTWHVPAAAYGPMVIPQGFDYSVDARRALEEAIAATVGDGAHPKVTPVVTEGHPAPELLKAAADAQADLLVVGSRGHGAFTGMLLGSVSEHCVSHSPCPVVVVRHTSAPS